MITQHQHHSCRFRFPPGPALCVLALASVLIALPASAASYAGRAVGAYVNVPTAGVGPLYLSDTGALASTGGWEGAGSPSENVPAVLTASVLNASTSGANGNGSGSASLADLVVFAGQPAQLTASFVYAQAGSGASGGSASTQVYDLTLGGLPVTVTGLPNQVVSLPGVATLTINEQTISPDGNSATINGLRLTLITGDEVKLASASTQVNPLGGSGLAKASLASFSSCNSSAARGVFAASWRPRKIFPVWASECIDFVTGGGWFEPPNSTRPGRVNFGFNAGPRSPNNTELKGNINVVDHDGIHIQGYNVDSYYPYGGDPEHCRMFTGDAKVNGDTGYRYTAGVCDYGEPGRDDRFQIHVTGPGGFDYLADNGNAAKPAFEGDLDGGNIQLHKSKCPNNSSTSSGSSI